MNAIPKNAPFSSLITELQTRLVDAVRPHFDPKSTTLCWGTDRRRDVIAAVKPVLGEMSIDQALVLKKLAYSALYSERIESDSIEWFAWEAAENFADDELINQPAKDMQDLDARLVFLRDHCIDEEDGCLVYSRDVISRVIRDVHKVLPAGDKK